MSAQKQEIVEHAASVVSADAGSIMQVISRAASDPNTDVDKLERLLGMYERITAREAQAAYTAALADMQPKLPTIDANSKIVHNNKVISQYAKWEDINDVIKPILAEHGFALDFSANETPKGISITAHLTHRAGYGKDATVPLPIDTSGAKNPVQGIGSSISYGKRYAAGLVLNLTSRAPDEKDDDGKSARDSMTISDEQSEALRAKIVETGADLPKFLAFFGIEKLADLPRAKFDAASRLLEQKAAAKGKPA